jgi:hypothetical protein
MRANRPAAKPTRNGDATQRGHHAHRHCLRGDRAKHLPPRGPERTQQGRLAGALGYEDREGVVDAEGRHDEGDEREHDQRLLERFGVLALDLLFQLAGQLGASQRLETVGEHRFEVAGELGLAHARLGRHGDARRLAGLGHEYLIREVGGEAGEGGRALAVGATECRQADDGHVDRVGRPHHGRVANSQVTSLGRRLVDDDLAWRVGRAALGQVVGVEPVVVDPVAGDRGPAAADGVAVGADDAGVALDAGRHRGDAVDGDDGVDQRPVDEGPFGDLLAADLVARANQRVGACVGVGEDVGEAVDQGAVDHEGARQEGHAEQDGRAAG